MHLKQFIKKKNFGFENFLNLKEKKKTFFFEKKINLLQIEKKIKFRISKNQNFIEYPMEGFHYLKDISKIIKKNKGGLLLIDYGFSDWKMKNTLKGVSNHKFANILENLGTVDITHNINFNLFKKFINKFNGLKSNLTNQKNFLIKMGIKQRAEIISKKHNFLKKDDIYYRLKRLIDEKQMGNLYKVMLIKHKDNNYN